MTDMLIRLLLIRHGESEFNKEGRFYGRMDPALTERGIQQAAELAKQLSDTDIAACYVSPATRARQTADVLAEHLELTPLVRENLWEQDFGEWEGKHPREFIGGDPKTWRKWIIERAYQPPGGESLDDVAKRANIWLEEAKTAHPGQTVMVVAHAGLLQTLLSQVMDVPLSSFWPFRFGHAGLADVLIFPEGPILVAFNGPPRPVGPPT